MLKHNLEHVTIAGRQCFVYLPNNYENGEKSYPVVYLNGDESTATIFEEAEYLSDIDYIIIGIVSENRLNELTPWAAPSLHPKFPNFGGEGDNYLKFIEDILKPAVDLTYRTLISKESTGIIGYSLGGLITIYASYNTNCFGCYASMSGSFWYPEFISYVSERKVTNLNGKFYISSGDSEGVGQKDIKKDALLFTKNMYEILVSNVTSSNVDIVWDEGGHHNNKDSRYRNALIWLNKNLVNS